MLNRRHLRLKALQALYIYLQSDDKNLPKAEQEVYRNIEKILDLYLYLISVPIEILHQARLQIEKNKQKRLPTQEDLNPNLRFVENKVLCQLESNKLLQSLLQTKKIQWIGDDVEMIKKLFKILLESDFYKEYMSAPKNSYVDDKNLVVNIFTQIIVDSELLNHWLEEKNIFWYDDLLFAQSKLFQVLERINPNTPESEIVFSQMYKDEDDREFLKDLIRKAVQNMAEYEKIIKEKAENWDYERIAFLDRIILILGITELLHMNSVPVKVTLNEYIDLAKDYSTDKSHVFVNGILDKVVDYLNKKGLIKKTGRGLMS